MWKVDINNIEKHRSIQTKFINIYVILIKYLYRNQILKYIKKLINFILQIEIYLNISIFEISLNTIKYTTKIIYF